MRRLSVVRWVATVGLAALVTAGAWSLPSIGGAGATTAGTVVGEGGDAANPIMIKLLHDDAAGLAAASTTSSAPTGDFGSYTNVDLDQGIADFVGSAPNTFGNDFAVTERPLTTAEAAAAKANGRTYAYVPFAAIPDALMTLVPNTLYQGTSTITPNQFCQHIPLTLQQLDGIFGLPAYTGWDDSNLSCTLSPSTPAEHYSFIFAANLDPTMENSALMSLLDSTTPSTNAFQAGLTSAVAHGTATTANTAPSEHWPYGGAAVPGGDEATFGKLIGLDQRTDALGTQEALMQLGAIMPVADVWTGDPLGPHWNLPTAAVQNVGGHYVVPSALSAAAAEANITLTSTSDPTTNNVVTSFNPISSDPTGCDGTGQPASGQLECPYNNYLMMESYLLVPTNGLSADKALALAQFIRFAVGGTGQADIASLGAAGATPAEVTADLAIAQQLDAEAATAAASSSTSTTTTTTSTTTAAAASTSSPGSANGDAPASTGSTGSGSNGTLATTGSDPTLLVGVGLAFLICGELARQFLRRRRAKT